MRLIRLTTALAVVALLAILALPGVVAAHPNDPKVSLCHRTDSETNPYRFITVGVHSIDGIGRNDHSHHTGPIWYPGAKADGVRWGDIIPPFDLGGVSFDGLNWTDEGQAIYRNECKVPTPTETPAPTPTPTPGEPTPTPTPPPNEPTPTPTPPAVCVPTPDVPCGPDTGGGTPPPKRTTPPTDTASPVSSTASNVWPVLLAIFAIGGSVLALRPRRR